MKKADAMASAVKCLYVQYDRLEGYFGHSGGNSIWFGLRNLAEKEGRAGIDKHSKGNVNGFTAEGEREGNVNGFYRRGRGGRGGKSKARSTAGTTQGDEEDQRQRQRLKRRGRGGGSEF